MSNPTVTINNINGVLWTENPFSATAKAKQSKDTRENEIVGKRSEEKRELISKSIESRSAVSTASLSN